MTSRRSHRHSPIGTRGSRKTLVNVGKAATSAPPLADGQVRCMVCRNATSTTPNGYLRKHRDLFGEPCLNKSTGERVNVATPPVVVPPLPRIAADPARNVAERNERPPGARLYVGSECIECGRWLPGERSICGRCAVTTGRRQ